MAAINWSVKSALKTQSLLFDFSKLSPLGAPIVNGTIFRTGIKFSAGLIIYIAKQGLTTVTTTNAACTFVFSTGGTTLSTLNNFFYAGNQHLVIAADVVPGELLITIGGVGDVTAGKFIYSFNYQEQKVN